MSDPLEMSGVWYGRWTSENRLVYPNSFIAHLAEAHGHIGGSISEPDRVGRVPTLRADVDGMRARRQVHFTKQYDGTGGPHHAVVYEGRISGDGTMVTGRWSLPRYSGAFEMQRESFAAEDLEEQEEIAEPVV
jgi:hypothetical protein